jgi:hypothetical protein
MHKAEKIMPAERHGDMARVKKPQVWCYHSIPIYWRTAGGDFILLKEPGAYLRERLGSDITLPEELFVLKKDRAAAVPEVQAALNAELEKIVAGDDVQRVKDLITDIVEETFAEPRAANMVPLKDTVKTVVTGYAGRKEAFRRIALMGSKDYSTVLHSVNVSALVLGYCAHREFATDISADLGLAGLLHDVGKLFVDKQSAHRPAQAYQRRICQGPGTPHTGLPLPGRRSFPARGDANLFAAPRAHRRGRLSQGHHAALFFRAAGGHCGLLRGAHLGRAALPRGSGPPAHLGAFKK